MYDTNDYEEIQDSAAARDDNIDAELFEIIPDCTNKRVIDAFVESDDAYQILALNELPNNFSDMTEDEVIDLARDAHRFMLGMLADVRRSLDGDA